MKEITRISLASLPYDIEVEARRELEQYLHDIEHALGADPDAMKEIESRIVELLGERGVNGNKVISKADIDAIKSQLGEPQAFVDDSNVASVHEAQASQPSSRKLFRDQKNEVIGGVCAGHAAYFKVDVVWVRLIFVILFLIGYGVMFIVYVVLWLITPPARTAAERLQMKGEAVTLEGIQTESAVVATQKNRDALVLKVLRIAAGICCLITAVAVMIVGAVFFYLAFIDSKIFSITSEKGLYVAALFIAGFVFAVGCFIVARGLFMNRYTKYFWVSLIVAAVISFGAAIVGLTGFSAVSNKEIREYHSFDTTKRLDAAELVGVTALNFEIDDEDVRYVASADAPRVEVTYNTRDYHDAPKAIFSREGEVATMSLQQPKGCEGRHCGLPRFVIYGPTLKSITATGGSSAYESNGQPELSLKLTNARLHLASAKPIDQLTLDLENGQVDAFDANVGQVRAMHYYNGSTARFGTVDTFAISGGETCTRYQQSEFSLVSARTITVNDAPWHTDDALSPCLSISVESDEEWDHFPS